MKRRALICGITGQDGAYLAQLLLNKGYQVAGTSRDAQAAQFANLKAIGIRDLIETYSMSPTDFRSVLTTLSASVPDEVYNLAGQSSVSLSFGQPVETFHSISIGTLNILEAIRYLDSGIRFYNAGSSETFGDTGNARANEDSPFRPRSPYAAAKAAAHWSVANYRDAYGLYACTGILFNHESPLRPPHFVTRKIVSTAVAIADGRASFLELGNVAIERDWGWAPEYVEAMWRMLQQEVPDDYVIATGQTNSLLDFSKAVFERLGLQADKFIRTNADLLRPSDIAVSCADPSKAARVLGWWAGMRMKEVVEQLIAAEQTRSPSDKPRIEP